MTCPDRVPIGRCHLMVEERRELQPAVRSSLIYRSIIMCVRDLPWGE
jgi:hypothetical protein